jgi:putative ABC transport system substrate-binding protein
MALLFTLPDAPTATAELLHVDRILKGTRPADLPIGAPPHFGLVINATSAKAMGYTVPPSLLKRADAIVQ